MKEALVDQLIELAAADSRMLVLTADLGFGMFERFSERFPKQFINVGVAEQNMTGVATGLALDGRIVFTYSIANFPTLRCLEQIRNDACYHGANVKIIAVGAGFSYGALGMSHHATEDIGVVRSLPELTLFSPGDNWEAAQCTAAAAKQPGTCYLRFDKGSQLNTGRAEESFEIGRARRLRDGFDATLAVTGGMLGETLAAADLLAAQGIDCRVLSFPTIKPLDIDALAAAALETGGLFTVEEHTIEAGFGGAVAEQLLETGAVPRTFHRFGLRAGFSSVVGSQSYLRRIYGFDAESIATGVLERLRSTARRPRFRGAA